MNLRARWTLLALLATMASCGRAGPPECPTNLKGVVGRTNLKSSSDASGIQWGGDSPVVSASIVSLKVECYSVLESSEGATPTYSYTVAATAYLTRAIVDSARFEAGLGRLFGGYDDEVKFQLLSSDGVVLEETEETVKLNSADAEFALSTKLEGLSHEQMRRAKAVQAFWTYGR